MRRTFIVNPRSNGGATGRTLDALKDVVTRRFPEATFVLTERSGHARQLARTLALDGVNQVVAVGGDGTFGEVVDGVVSSGVPRESVAVGLVHQGTGGDFRRTLGLEHRLDRYLDALERDAPSLLDVGRLQSTGSDGRPQVRHVVNVASVGMGGRVALDVSRPARLLGGSARYLAASLKALVSEAPLHLRCEVESPEGPRSIDATTRILALCNGRYFGGGMELNPRGDPGDGWFDVLWVEGESTLPVLAVMGAVYSGDHLAHAAVRTLRARRISVTGTRPGDEAPVDADGEYAGSLPLSLEVLPGAVRVLV